MSAKFKVGERVRSRSVGSRPAFIGRVVNVFRSGAGHWCYDVEDEDGAQWLRSTAELRAA